MAATDPLGGRALAHDVRVHAVGDERDKVCLWPVRPVRYDVLTFSQLQTCMFVCVCVL